VEIISGPSTTIVENKIDNQIKNGCVGLICNTSRNAIIEDI
jgi:hypothetical protein